MQRIVAALACTVFLAFTTARADTTLVVSIAADPTGLDPEAVLNNTSGFIMSTIYDGLIRYKSGTVETEPGLAQSWDVSADALSYTFHLRKAVKYHDGTPFNAQALIATLDRQLNKNDPNYIGHAGPAENLADFTYGSVASYRAIDDSAVEFKMKEPSAALLASLAMVWNGVVSPTAAANKDFRNHPIGSGPFIFREWRQRDEVVLDANPDYWRGKPMVDHLVFKEFPDSQAALLALRRGEVQIMGDVATPVISSIRSDPNLILLTQPGLAINGMAIPNDVPPFNDKRVRQALNFAVDKEAIGRALYGGLSTPMASPLPEAQWGFDRTMTGYPYDPAKAKELLAAAGVRPGFKVELLAYSTPRGYNPAGPDLAVALQGYFQKVGIEADVRKLDIGAFLATVRSGKYRGLFLSGFSGDNGDPDNFMSSLFDSRQMPVGDTSHYKNEAVERLMTEAARLPDQDKRLALYKSIQRQIMDDAPWVFVNSVIQVRAARKEVRGFGLNPTQMFFDMDRVSVEK
jgi:peptide/nickel transport system substrate-binding protein